MKIVYCSRTGNIEKAIKKLNWEDTLKLVDGSERVNEDFILFTYTDGKGVVPSIVIDFLDNNSRNLRAVISSGNIERHPDTFNFAGIKLENEYGVPLLAKLNKDGTDEDIKELRDKLIKF